VYVPAGEVYPRGKIMEELAATEWRNLLPEVYYQG
jgi:hypothetical protein